MSYITIDGNVFVLLELTRPISFGLWRADGEFLGIEKNVAVPVTDGDGSQMLRGRMGTETMSDGDGWGWIQLLR